MFVVQLILLFAFSNVNCYYQQSPYIGVVGGHVVAISDAPYMASLRLNGTYHWCGGSIIHEQFILTAAHCIVPNRQYKVLVGTGQVDGKGDLYDVNKIIVHKEYSNITKDFDMCLVKLEKPVNFGPNVTKIILGSVTKKPGVLVNVTGWGYTSINGTVSNDLRQATIPIVKKSVCALRYALHKQKLSSHMLCAGGNGKDACLADSGGPLTRNNVQVGVTSFGAGCGILPGVYMSISAFMPWIKETIKNNL